MKIKFVVIFISFVHAIPIFSCDCEWGGDFFTIIKETDLVAKVKVIRKFKVHEEFNDKMEVEIVEIYKGKENRKIIGVWGDNGYECRPYIDYFVTDQVYYLALYKYDEAYEQMNCGEMYLKAEGEKVVSENYIGKELPQVGEMTVSEFEARLKLK